MFCPHGCFSMNKYDLYIQQNRESAWISWSINCSCYNIKMYETKCNWISPYQFTITGSIISVTIVDDENVARIFGVCIHFDSRYRVQCNLVGGMVRGNGHMRSRHQVDIATIMHDTVDAADDIYSQVGCGQRIVFHFGRCNSIFGQADSPHLIPAGIAAGIRDQDQPDVAEEPICSALILALPLTSNRSENVPLPSPIPTLP